MKQRVEKWRRWIDGPIKNGVLTLHHNRQIWRGFQEIVREHGSLPDSAFWAYHLNIYAIAQAVAVRRQTDRDPRVASLQRLLEEVADEPEALTEAWWIGLWNDESDRPFASAQWREKFGGEVMAHLDPTIPQRDLALLETEAGAVKNYVDRHIAHAEQGTAATEIDLTLNNLDAAIDALGSLFRKYGLLLTAADWVMLEPAIQHDWRAPFRIPWIDSNRVPNSP